MAEGSGWRGFVRVLTRPWLIPGAILSTITLVYQTAVTDALFSVLWSHSGLLFNAVSLGSLTLLPMWPPSSLPEYATYAAGLVFLAYLLNSLLSELRKRRTNT